MGSIEMKYPGLSMPRGAIATLEGLLGVPLPEEYKRFLREYIGGTPRAGHFAAEGFDHLLWVDALYGLDESLLGPPKRWGQPTLAGAHAMQGRIIPAGALIAGCVCRDDLLLVFYRGRRKGQVFIKHLEELPFPPGDRWEKEPELGLHYVAGSFGEFVDLLRAAPTLAEHDQAVAAFRRRKRGTARRRQA